MTIGLVVIMGFFCFFRWLCSVKSSEEEKNLFIIVTCSIQIHMYFVLINDTENQCVSLLR